MKSQQFNFRFCKIPVPSGLHISRIRELLLDYGDYEICDLLECGWPINHNRSITPSRCVENHKGVFAYREQVGVYLIKELKRGSAIGPFEENPFDSVIAVSPLNAISKKDTDEPRIILDLSWPLGSSVNDCISIDTYLDEPICTVYPKIDNLVELIKEKGVGCLLYKKDLKKAYRQIPIDPSDIPLLGFNWDGKLYFDTALPMGMRSSAYICQRVTNAINYVMGKHNFNIVNYLDDFAGAEVPMDADSAYEKLGAVLLEFGLMESKEKARSPATSMSFLGVEFNTVDLTLEVTDTRLLEINHLLKDWLRKKVTTRVEIESLVGKLMFVSKCVRSSRVFLSRILNFLRDMIPGVQYEVDLQLLLDLKWWHRFLHEFNGTVMMPFSNWSRPDSVIAVDACLTGIGGICYESREFFHLELPQSFQDKNLHINQIESLCLVIAIKLWHGCLRNRKILIYSDNMATVQVFNSGKAHDMYLQQCLREVAFLLCINEAELKTIHIAGINNRVPDLLSRWHLNTTNSVMFWYEMQKLKVANDVNEVTLPASYLNMDCVW